jgi:hypothetical protein
MCRRAGHGICLEFKRLVETPCESSTYLVSLELAHNVVHKRCAEAVPPSISPRFAVWRPSHATDFGVTSADIAPLFLHAWILRSPKFPLQIKRFLTCPSECAQFYPQFVFRTYLPILIFCLPCFYANPFFPYKSMA